MQGWGICYHEVLNVIYDPLCMHINNNNNNNNNNNIIENKINCIQRLID